MKPFGLASVKAVNIPLYPKKDKNSTSQMGGQTSGGSMINIICARKDSELVKTPESKQVSEGKQQKSESSTGVSSCIQETCFRLILLPQNEETLVLRIPTMIPQMLKVKRATVKLEVRFSKLHKFRNTKQKQRESCGRFPES